MKLSSSQVQEFRETGVLIVKNLLTAADLAPVEAELSEFVDRRAHALKAEGKIAELHKNAPFDQRIGLIYAQCEDIVQGLDIMQLLGKATFAFLHNKNLLDAVECLVGPEITCSPIQHVNAKVPGNLGKGNYALVYWHQDACVTLEDADASDIVTCWIPLVDATVQNGCMQIMPGVSKRGYIEHLWFDGKKAIQIDPELLPATKPIDAECPRGGAIFMTKFTPHRGLPNLSDRVRWTMDLRYQRTGTSTGRTSQPDFPVRSASDPASVLTDHAEWRRRWLAPVNTFRYRAHREMAQK